MITFMQLEVGDPIFFIEVDNFKLTSDKVQKTTIKSITKDSNAATYNVDIELDNGSKIRVHWNNEAQKIDKNQFTLGILSDLNCFIYATTEKGCKNSLISIVKSNYEAIYKYYTKVNANMLKLLALQANSAQVKVTEVPETITTEAVYV